MKHKITFRLIGYFSAVLLLFSLIAGLLFWALFAWRTAEIHEAELKKRAVSIADTLSQFSQRGHKGRGQSGGYGAYLRFLDEIAMSEVWLADEHAQTIQVCQSSSSLSYSELPAGAEELIAQVFAGNVVANTEFSPLLDVPSITVGAPVHDAAGNITAAVLLQRHQQRPARWDRYTGILHFDGLVSGVHSFCFAGPPFHPPAEENRAGGRQSDEGGLFRPHGGTAE